MLCGESWVLSYELIDDEEPFYSEVPELQGVWATGRSLEECRQNLAEVIDDWILVRLSHGLAIPPLDEVQITPPVYTNEGYRGGLAIDD